MGPQSASVTGFWHWFVGVYFPLNIVENTVYPKNIFDTKQLHFRGYNHLHLEILGKRHQKNSVLFNIIHTYMERMEYWAYKQWINHVNPGENYDPSLISADKYSSVMNRCVVHEGWL